MLNKWIGIGRLTHEPEIRSTANGKEVLNFSIAVERTYKPKGEERQADFFNCTAFGKSATFITNYFHKGDPITIEGRLENQSWTDNETGKPKTVTKIMVTSAEFTATAKKEHTESDTAVGESFLDGEMPESIEDMPF